jgi:hypothetical protein
MRLILIILTALSFPATAEVYKWVDESGVTHFGSQPPTAEKETVKIRASGPGSSGSGTDSAIMRQARELDRLDAEKQRQRSYDDRANEIRAGYDNLPDYVCTGAKDRLEGAKEDWASEKRQGYSLSEQQYNEQRINRLERERDNYCR